MPTPEGQNLAERLVPRQYQTELFQEARKRNVRHGQLIYKSCYDHLLWHINDLHARLT